MIYCSTEDVEEKANEVKSESNDESQEEITPTGGFLFTSYNILKCRY